MTRVPPVILFCCCLGVFLAANRQGRVHLEPVRVTSSVRQLSYEGLKLFRVTGPETESTFDPARAALAKGEYPWYDSVKGRVRPVDLTPKSESSWLQSFSDWIEGVVRATGDAFARIARVLHLPTIGSIGNALPIILTGIGVVLLAVLIRVLWASARFGRSDDDAPDRTVGATGRITMLPAGMGSSSVADPWAEAVERRRQGDYAGAVIFLFAHQLLELDRRGLIRLTTGGTGRKYVRSLDDSRLRELLSATLGLFEQAYYGHKQPTATSFEPVWAGGQLFQEHLASIEKRTS